MKNTIYTLFASLLILSIACSPQTASSPAARISNPPAPNFNTSASDQKAIELADQVMEKMGGRQNWDATRFIHWTFFGRRSLLWDKHTGVVRIDVKGDTPATYLVDVNSGEGQVLLNGEAQENPDTLKKYLTEAKNIWINDSYWLVMPFKLKDSGVSLNYVGQDTTLAGKAADVLQLTFAGVGVTPQNRYLVYVEQESGLVKRWDFFTNASDEEPRFSTPWEDYKPMGKILLSGNRGRGQLTDIMVFEEVPEKAFTSLDPFDISTLK